MSKNRRLLLGATLALVMVVATLFTIRYRSSPAYALGQVGEAVEDRNRLRFQTYVDLDRFLPAAVDQLIGTAMLESMGNGEAGGVEVLGMALGSALTEQFKPALTQAFRGAILRSVERGSLDSLYAHEEANGTVSLEGIRASTGADASSFVGLDDIEREGDVALAGLRFRHEHLDTTLVLKLRMERSDGTWRVVAPENLDSYLKDVEAVREKRLEAVNAAADAELGSVVQFGPWEREIDGIAGFTFLKFNRTVTNRSDQPIRLSIGWLAAPEDSGLEDRIVLAEAQELAPGETTTLTANLFGTRDEPLDPAYRARDPREFGIRLSLVQGTPQKARYVGHFSDWGMYEIYLEEPDSLAQRLLRSGTSREDSSLDDLLEGESGPWRVTEETNPLNDSPIVILANEATSGLSRFGERPTLVLRCRNNTTEVYITWHDYLGSGGKRVSYRVGNGEQQTASWSQSTDNQATFYPGSDVAFIQELMTADRFVAQVTPYNESPVTAVFQLSSLSEKVQPLRRACGW